MIQESAFQRLMAEPFSVRRHRYPTMGDQL